ncbi:MAG TPA: glycosyltransferase family 1 protein [Terriglobales bacterium]|nr:glycosyltransferase family 1 protein [Terriglobales bacterium]
MPEALAVTEPPASPAARVNYEVAVDARWLRTGLGTYIYNLLAGLSILRDRVRIRGLVMEENAGRVSPFCQSVRIVKAPIYTLREQIEIPKAARGCDLLHVPHYNAPLLYSGKLVVSIHDLIHLMPEGHNHKFPVFAYAWTMLHLVARRADHIVTGSEHVKRQLVERLAVRESKISVIYHGVSEEFRPSNREQARALVAAALGRQTPYMLCVSALRPHKNLARLLAAAQLFWQRTNSAWELLVIGAGPEKARLIEQCARLGITAKVNLVDQVAQDVLPSFYAAAQFLIMPSLVEGFGLPVLEAMACGTPVLSSSSSSLPEVGGDAVAYFDPLNVEEMAAAMQTVSASPETRAALREKGLLRAQRFSWRESARKHQEVYCEVLQKKARAAPAGSGSYAQN